MRRLIGLAIVLALVGSSQAALAGGGSSQKRPPHLSLRYEGDVVQRDRPFTYCWSYSTGDGEATGMCADGFPRFPRAAEVESPTRLSIRVHYPYKPERWFLNAYRAIVRREHYDEPVGDPEKLDFKLRPHRVNGEVKAWDLIFRVTEPMRHYYLETGGDLRQGDAFYALHVKTT
jgi:hypothetical protein